MSLLAEHREREQDRWTITREALGVSAIFRCGDRSFAQHCEQRITAVAPSPSCSHASVATLAMKQVGVCDREQAEGGGDVDVRELDDFKVERRGEAHDGGDGESVRSM